jgi:hypothetical protein
VVIPPEGEEGTQELLPASQDKFCPPAGAVEDTLSRSAKFCTTSSANMVKKHTAPEPKLIAELSLSEDELGDLAIV